MLAKNLFGWMALVALIGSSVAACSGADVSSDDPAGSSVEELRGGKLCGGPRDLTCGKDEYCAGKVGRCPGEHAFGHCAAKPDVCYKIYKPVCGCDGTTYGNDCEAAAAGVSIASQGPCAPPPAFCGGIANIPCPDGQACVDDPNDDCDPKNGGADCGGICIDAPKPTFCGGIAGIPCPEGQTCIDDPSDDCNPKNGGADCGGICIGTAGTCGGVTCGKGTVCCNPLLGICTKPGMVCIQ